MAKPFITLDRVTLRLGERLILPETSWQIRADEHWAILGPNGSGKSTLVRSLWGGVPLRSGRILYEFASGPGKGVPPKERIGYVSFEMHQSLMEKEELEQELREYAGKKDEVTTAEDVIFSGILAGRPLTGEDERRLAEVAGLLEIGSLLDRPITALSTGEVRKTLIARALLKEPRLLILDEPFDGLDEGARQALAASIQKLMGGPMRVLLVAHRLEEVVAPFTHVLFIREGRIFLKGPKEEMLTSENVSRLYGCDLRVVRHNGAYALGSAPEEGPPLQGAPPPGAPRGDVPESLVEMKDTTVRYGETVVLDGLTWSMRRGENWAILGPNGSGKSTILKLILGEHLQGYANRIRLFGRPKGSGETLWEIRKQMGVVSPELQVQYRKRMSAFDVIASGFYDSIGLYRHPTEEQRETVGKWVRLLMIGDIAKEPYHQLSYGQKRMILLARAMVKGPALLIVDEPCHGLDILNRRRILKILERIGRTQTSLLYVTNHREEILACVTHVLRLRRGRVLRQGRKEEVLG